MRTLTVYRVGSLPYGEAHALQERLVAARQADVVGDVMLLLEHPKVITLGRKAVREHVLLDDAGLSREGYELYDTGRGGDVTFHGPGQLVGYPIMSLSPDREDVRRYVRDLEETMIRTCADYGILACRVDGLNGTWVGDRKIGAVGVRISRWVTMHGFALNVCTELDSFRAIVPCGIADRGVTSMERELGRVPDLQQVGESVASHFGALLERELCFVDGIPKVPERPEV